MLALGNYQRLESHLAYHFNHQELLVRALTHRSHSNPHNERFEFLGDSVLNCVIASELYQLFGEINEGDLSRLRANLVRQETLCDLAQRIELGNYLRLGEGEMKSGGFRRPSILADALEAIFGAIFLDSGFDDARQVISKLYQPFIQSLDPNLPVKDAKSLLQEYLQGRKIPLPQYNVIATRGEAHQQQFEVECLIPQLGLRMLGMGASRRGAEQEAAQRAYQQLTVKSEG